MKYVSALAKKIHNKKWELIPKDLFNFLSSRVMKKSKKHIVPTFYGILSATRRTLHLISTKWEPQSERNKYIEILR